MPGTHAALVFQSHLAQYHLQSRGATGRTFLPFWLGVALPVVVFVVLMIYSSRKQLADPVQRNWMVGSMIVILLIIGGTVVLQQAVSPGVLMIVAGAIMLAGSGAVLWRRHRAGALLLAVDKTTPWYYLSPWLWYSMAVLWGLTATLVFFGRHDLSWLIMGMCFVVNSLVMARGAQRLEVREGGLTLSPYGHTAWPRIRGYTLSDTTLTLRVRPLVGPALPVSAEVHGSLEQRQALRQELDRHIPAAA